MEAAGMTGQQDYLQPVSMGTTIMAASFDGGVVLGADSRTSTGSCEQALSGTVAGGGTMGKAAASAEHHAIFADPAAL